MSLKRKFKALLPGLVFLGTLVALAYLVKSGLAGEWISEDWSERIDRDVRGKGAAGELLYLAVGGVA